MQEYTIKVTINKEDLMKFNLIRKEEDFEDFVYFLEDEVEHDLIDDIGNLNHYAEKFYKFQDQRKEDIAERRSRLFDEYKSLLAKVSEYPEESESEELRELKDQADKIKWELIELNKILGRSVKNARRKEKSC